MRGAACVLQRVCGMVVGRGNEKPAGFLVAMQWVFEKLELRQYGLG